MINNYILIFLVCLLGNQGNVSQQDTTYYYQANYRPTDNIEQARFYKHVIPKNSRIVRVNTFVRFENEWRKTRSERIKVLNDSDQKIRITQGIKKPEKISRKFTKQPQGDYLFHEYKDGNLIRSGITKSRLPLLLDGEVKVYYANGKLKSKSMYVNNQLKENENWLPDGSKYIDNIFYAVDEIPEYKLGQQHLSNFVIQSLKNKNVGFEQYHATIVLGWVVTPAGEMEGVHVIEGDYASLNKKLVSTFQELPGKWEPAKLDGKEVKYFMRFPVNLQYQNNAGIETLELSAGQLRWD
ncbi:MAG: hypothetical protein ACOC3T_06380 [Bacteroidota bacterium]